MTKFALKDNFEFNTKTNQLWVPNSHHLFIEKFEASFLDTQQLQQR